MSIRRGTEGEKRHKKPSRTVTFLLTCCVFLLIICACLITVLVFVGRHILYNSPSVVFPRVPYRLPVPQRSFKRLPAGVEPLLYDLTLLPNLSKGLYKGSVNITISVTEPRNDLVIHSKNLSITEVNLMTDTRTLSILKVREIYEDEVLVITPDLKLSPNTYYLAIKFEGVLFGKLTGFYRSNYKKTSGESRYVNSFTK